MRVPQRAPVTRSPALLRESRSTAQNRLLTESLVRSFNPPWSSNR